MSEMNEATGDRQLPIRHNRLWMVLLLGSLTAFGPLSMDMYLPGLPGVADDFGTTASFAQLSITAALIGLGIGQLVFGPMSDIKGRRRPLLFTLAVYAVASLLCVFSSDVWIFVGLRLIQGISAAAGIVIARAASRDLYSGKELTKFIAMLALVNGAAPILAPLLGGIVMNFASWRFVFVILAAIGVVMLFAVAFSLPETLPEQNRKTGGLSETFGSFGILLKDRAFMGIALAQAFVSTSMFAYIAGSPFVLQNIYGITPQQFSIVFAVNGIGIIIAAQLTGRLSAAVSEVKMMKWGVSASFAGGLLLVAAVLLSMPMWVLLVGLFLVVSSVGVVNTTGFSLGMGNHGKIAGSASAFLGILPFAGGGLVSPLVGIAGDQNALPMAIVIFLSSTLAFSIYHAVIKRSIAE
ncbi:multidrug effflux MFS transporter [Edaphobacillus lindanitolerans]|uniref:Bcr/CflA family efflux transporter n=1 Tax=Edaphobacillus lindanitolerans TaxID=550447 RepID=A0A1U7PPU7_9BACI|nr:multidrug effflux MFS transporter [Edaphobacillus lindanitolerans]SIT88294.1 MFS transporter, DHA1 family, bicyclomycin/chloramphenicol resistance protein [Edaphobacillus lindanitolerans]